MQDTQETHVWSLDQEDLLEEGMAIHSSIVAWKISWTEEPGVAKSQDRTEQLSMHTYTLVTLSCVSCTTHGSTNSVKHICPGVLAEAGQGNSAPVNTVSWSESLWRPLGVLSHVPPGVSTGDTPCVNLVTPVSLLLEECFIVRLSS